MTIFERLFQTIRAEVFHRHQNPFTKDDFAQWAESYYSFSSASYGHSQRADSSYQPPPPSTQEWRDPLIAGYYANLELPYGSDLDAVRNAWKKLLVKYHPDRHCADPEKQRMATELAKGLNHAYRELEKHLKK